MPGSEVEPGPARFTAEPRALHRIVGMINDRIKNAPLLQRSRFIAESAVDADRVCRAVPYQEQVFSYSARGTVRYGAWLFELKPYAGLK